MTQLGQDLRTFLLADSDISTAVGASRISQNHVPETYDGLYVWFARAATEHERTIDQATGEEPFRQFWDLEVIGETLGDVLDAAEHIVDLDASGGTFGAGTVQVLWVSDHNDDYLPRGIYSDEGLYVSSFQLEVVGYVPAA